jgi:hypothetical protein
MARKPGSSGAVVTHADGTAVDAAHPAKVGEQLVMYAVGVGATKPPVVTGAPSPMPPAAATGGFMLNFDFQPNAPPTPGMMLINKWFVAPPGPVFVGLTPNFVGLYQINLGGAVATGGSTSCVTNLVSGPIHTRACSQSDSHAHRKNVLRRCPDLRGCQHAMKSCVALCFPRPSC